MIPIHFDVQLSAPHDYEQYGKPGVMVEGMRNHTLDVITTSAARAIELALERYPRGEVHVCQRRGSTKLIFDPLVVEILTGDDST